MTDVIVVCGATGRQGGSVTRRLLERGRAVRAMTRNGDAKGARALGELGAEVVVADMDDVASLRRAFEGAAGVYSVQNGITSGFDEEVRQGRNVADAAEAAGVGHLVYASAGFGRTTGVPSWDAKLPIEARVRDLGTAWTILRPLAFMELMTDPKFYPAVGTWRIFPKLTGTSRSIPWLSVTDLGEIVVKVFGEPAPFAGKEIPLASDVRTLAECRALHREVMGKDPRTFPMPIWLFDRFTRGDPTTMWRWLRTGEPDLDTAPTRAIHPSALTVKEWMVRMRQASGTPR